jgi:phage baseplate assembly protein gpV
MIGDTKLTGTASGYMVETPTFTIKANVVIEGNVDISGANLNHNGKNVGSTHGHVTAPPGPPGPPV